MFYLPKGLCESRTQWGPFDVFPFYCVWERVFDSFTSQAGIRLFEILKIFYPPNGAAKAEPKVVQLFLLMSYFVLGNEYWTLIYRRFFSSLRPWKSFIPRRDFAKQIPKEVQLFLLMSYFVLGNVYWTFKFWAGNPPFWDPPYVLSPRGTLRSRARKGSNRFYFTYYPPEGLCGAEPERGPIVFTLHFIGVGRGTGGFNFRGGNPPFWNLENVLSPRGTLRSRARKGSNCFYLCFIGIGKDTGGFSFRSGNPPFWKLENVPQRDYAEQSPKGVQLFLLYILLV